MIGYPLVFQIFGNELKDQEREVCFVDIAYDEIPERYYKESEVGPPCVSPLHRYSLIWHFNFSKKTVNNTEFSSSKSVWSLMTTASNEGK